MASKTLIRTGATQLVNRVLQSNRNLVTKTPNSNPQKTTALLHFNSSNNKIAPFLFPSLTKLQEQEPIHHLPQNDVVSNEQRLGFFLRPFGLPSLPFFCPEHEDSSDESMLLLPKRTFQPSTIRRKRNHGFFARKATKGGRRVIARRIAKRRSRITA